MPLRNKPKRPRSTTRFDQLSDDEIVARWKSLQPKFIRSLAFFAGTAAFLFLANHIFGLSQRMTDIADIAFEVACIFTVCFVLLVVMGLYFGRGTWRNATGPRKG